MPEPSTPPESVVEFYWRPGCGFCGRLYRDLDALGVELVQHNIWDDPGAASRVRAVARGHETVPTIIIGDRALVNPSAREVCALLEASRVTPDSTGSSDR